MLEVGMADSLITRLSSLPDLVVRSIGSVRRYAGPDQDLSNAARELKVTWIVDGSVQRWGSQIRITARLINAATGEAAWAGSFDRDFTNIFDVQEAISLRVAAVLAPHLTVRDRGRLSGPGGTRDIEAYQLYLIARHHAQSIRSSALQKSIEFYKRAIARDPAYALAYAGLAESYRRTIFGADAEPAFVSINAKAAAERAIALDPSSAEGYAELGWHRFWFAWDWAGAEVIFRKAIGLNPNVVESHFGFGNLLSTLDRNDEALEQYRVARERDPLSLILLTIESSILFGEGRRDEAKKRLQRVLEIEPEFWVAHLALGGFEHAEGKIDQAIESFRTADRLSDGSSQPAASLGYVLARNGHRDEAKAILGRLRAARRDRFVPPSSIGAILAGLGDIEAALAELERAYAVRDVRLTLIRDDWRWKPVRDQPRYRVVLEKMKLAF